MGVDQLLKAGYNVFQNSGDQKFELLHLVQLGVSPIGGSPIEVSPIEVSPIGGSPIRGSPIGVSPNGGGLMSGQMGNFCSNRNVPARDARTRKG